MKVPTAQSRNRGEYEHTVKLTKRGAYLNKMTGGATRGGVHRNRKKELSRNFCRKS